MGLGTRRGGASVAVSPCCAVVVVLGCGMCREEDGAVRGVQIRVCVYGDGCRAAGCLVWDEARAGVEGALGRAVGCGAADGAVCGVLWLEQLRVLGEGSVPRCRGCRVLVPGAGCRRGE